MDRYNFGTKFRVNPFTNKNLRGIITMQIKYVGMVELADASDSKSKWIFLV